MNCCCIMNKIFNRIDLIFFVSRFSKFVHWLGSWKAYILWKSKHSRKAIWILFIFLFCLSTWCNFSLYPVFFSFRLPSFPAQPSKLEAQSIHRTKVPSWYKCNILYWIILLSIFSQSHTLALYASTVVQL